MTLTATPPRYDSWRDMALPIKQGATGWPAYAVQTAVGADPDGDWGPNTEQAVRAWQKAHKLTPDGIVGPETQTTILELAGIDADRRHGMPEGVGYGFAVAEGANMLAATNWSVAGGVDCGPAQWRVLGPPFDLAALKMAFNARLALNGAVGRLQTTRESFESRNSHLRSEPSTALRVAVLSHNWPAGADMVVRSYPGGGRWYMYVPRPRDPATWIRNPDGSYPYTRAGWAKEYAARVLRFVAS